MSKLYSSDTTIVWNGNVVKGGSEVVTEFFNSLPATEHTLHTLDCQPVSGIMCPFLFLAVSSDKPKSSVHPQNSRVNQLFLPATKQH